MIVVSEKLIKISERMSVEDINASLDAALKCDDYACLKILAKYDPYVFDDQIRSLDGMLYREELSWGDYIYLYEQAYPDFNYDFGSEDDALCTPSAESVSDAETEPEIEAIPDLRQRKDIWENFPVVVLKTGAIDGRERHIIRWNNKKLEEQSNDKTDILPRLRQALLASRFWTVESAEDNNDICIIAMNFKKTFADADTNSDAESETKSVVSAISADSEPKSKSKAESKTSNLPTLRRLNDIKEHFPVVWNAVEDAKVNTYALKLHGANAKKMGVSLEAIHEPLLAALRASKAWTVLPTADKSTICLLEMKVRA